MASSAVIQPPAVLPSDFDKWDIPAQQGPPKTLPSDFAFEPNTQTVSTGTLSAGKNPTWLEDAEEDVRSGGQRTALGKILGKLQGSNIGYSGLGGVSEATQNFMGSPLLGALHAAQGVQQTPDHPIAGPIHAVGGVLEAGTIPSMFVGGPAGNVAGSLAEKIPTRAAAGKLFDEVMAAAKDQPVPLTRSMQPLERIQQLVSSGATAIPAADKLYERSKSIVPLTYQEARDFASNVASRTRQENATTSPTVKALLSALKGSLHADIGDVASSVGKGEEYAQAVKQYAQASNIRSALSRAAKWALPAAGGIDLAQRLFKPSGGGR